MSYSRRSILAACLLVAGTATSAFAGGSFGYPSSANVQVPAPIPIPDYASAFYLRGDFGWALYENPDIGETGINFTNPSLDNSVTVGAGFGVNFRDKIRGDITVDFIFEEDVKATNPTTGNIHSTTLSSVAVLTNLYYDFRGRDRFTPYVGGGIGLAYNETNNLITNAGTSARGGNSTEFAAALMAGFSYRLDDSWMLDAGYRFLFLGDTKTSSSVNANSMHIDDIKVHELRIGVRYELQ
jgi:opacity protein-like surface antigen